MNWRGLLQNQWFQLCLLVAALSSGTTIYNLAKLKPNPNPNDTTSRSTSTPTPIVTQRRVVEKLKPKRNGQWILDASGGRDADSSDIEAVAASLAEGDIVTLRPGTYTGSCEIGVSARLVGPASGKGIATIRGTDAQRIGISISGKKVSFENVSINFEAAGDSPAMRIWRDAAVEMTNCSMSTQSKFGILVSENASLNAQSSEFRAPSGGCCLKYEGYARGNLNRCSLAAGRWGLEAVNGAQVQGSNCAFQKVGLVNGIGLIIGVVGGRASLTLEACQFTDNTATIMADEGAALRITGSTFRNNGITGEAGNSNFGLICAQNGAKVFLKDDTFEDNKQGLVALKAGNLTLERVQMQRTGLVTANEKLKAYCNSIGAGEPGCTITVSGCTIADSLNDGFIIAGGAHLKAVQTIVSNSAQVGLVLGFPNVGASQAELDNVRFLGSGGDGIWVNSGSQLEMQNCEVSTSNFTGLEAQDSGTQAKITNTIFRGCKVMGIDAHAGATVYAAACTLENTTRGAQAGLPNDSQKSGWTFLENCTVRDNSVFGIGACRGATLVMKGGFLGNNRQNAFHEPGGTVRLER